MLVICVLPRVELGGVMGGRCRGERGRGWRQKGREQKKKERGGRKKDQHVGFLYNNR
jgi:hypothetical protein